jgi:ATP-dependent phosphofructokinase / diphosphate-dependent phosphofructokinase
MSKNLKGNAVVGQSGGPTCVINQSLVGVIEEVCEQECIGHLWGAVHGVRGIVNNNFVDLKQVSRRELDDIALTPSAALGSTRDKPNEEYCNRIFEIFKKKNVHYFFYNGGNDSANTAQIVNMLAQKAGYELKVFHVPKTIDNDLLVTDHSPGYGTAATFVAHAVIGDDLDNRSLGGIKVDIVMGRDAGFLTASAMLAHRRDDDGPHLIYVPEAPVTMEQFVSDVQNVYAKYKRCLAVVSEGIRDLDKVPWAKKIQKQLEADAHGNVQLSGSGALADFLIMKLKEKLPNERMRADTFGYLQRSFPGLISQTDAYEARYCGRMAVYYAAGPYTSGSVCMQRFGKGDRYRIETFVTTLASVAAGTKELPQEYINPEGNNILPSYREYVSPLVAPLPKVGYIKK